MTHICVTNLGHTWLKKWLVAYSAPSHYPNRCCIIKIHTFSFKKMHLKTSSAKQQPFCLGLNVLNDKIALEIYWHPSSIVFEAAVDLIATTQLADDGFSCFQESHFLGNVQKRRIQLGDIIDVNGERRPVDIMMTSSNGNIFRVTGHLCGKFTGPRWISRTKASDAELWCFFDLHLNKRLSKQPWGWWFETPEWSLWRHRNDIIDKI